MAEGVPVVASLEGTIPEIVIEGENGFLVEKGNGAGFADKILQLLKDEGLRRRISVANRTRFETSYAPEAYGRRMVETFRMIDKEEHARQR
jgi:glycosyltransferase involved in cell wall biosynthesis